MKYRSRFSSFIPVFGILLAGLLSAGCQSDGENGREDDEIGRQIEFTRGLSFIDLEGDTVSTIEVAVADEESERNQGLMDVNELPRDKGMLFIFDEEQPLSFWMANTPLSLDIIFVNSKKQIVRIHRSTQPFAESNFTSGEPARYAVETNGGYCISHDIQEGMKVSWEEE